MTVKIPTFNKAIAEFWVTNEQILKCGDEIVFAFNLHGNPWQFVLKREETPLGKYKYALCGNGGEYGTWARRYPTMADAFLHVVNNLNENVNIKNRYASLDQWIKQKAID